MLSPKCYAQNLQRLILYGFSETKMKKTVFEILSILTSYMYNPTLIVKLKRENFCEKFIKRYEKR